MAPTQDAAVRCPCRKKSETTPYAECCEPFHTRERAAPTAEALMRSRYSAFVMRNGDYLLATRHPSTRDAQIAFTPGQVWTSLRIVSTRDEGETAFVEFVARSLVSGRSEVRHENSRFVRENGQWLYIDGEAK